MKMKTITLRNLIYIIIVFVFISGCKKEEEEPTTYQIVNNNPFYNYAYSDGSIYEVIVYYYIGTEIVKQENISRISSGGGKTGIIEVNSSYEKLRISFKFIPPTSAYYSSPNNVRYYIAASKRLEKGINNTVTLTGDTQISTSPLIYGEERFFTLGDVNRFMKI